VWGAWRGFGLGVAVLCVLLRAYQIKRLCVCTRQDKDQDFSTLDGECFDDIDVGGGSR
jgi:hypothetical protein